MDEVRPATDRLNETAASKLPEDVAALYSWAEVDGASYRDFSAARRIFRAMQRLRTVEEQRERAFQAIRDCQERAHSALTTAREALEAATRLEGQRPNGSELRRAAEEAFDRAEQAAIQHTQEAERHAAVAEECSLAAAIAEQEAAEARQQARPKPAAYAEEVKEVPAAPTEPEMTRRSAMGAQDASADVAAKAGQADVARTGESTSGERQSGEQPRATGNRWDGVDRRGTSLKGVAADTLRAYRRRAEEKPMAEGLRETSSQQSEPFQDERLGAIHLDDEISRTEGAKRLLIPSPPLRDSAQTATGTIREASYLRMRRSAGQHVANDGAEGGSARTGYRDERVREGNQFLDRRAVPRETPRPAPVPPGTENSASGVPADAPDPKAPAWLATPDESEFAAGSDASPVTPGPESADPANLSILEPVHEHDLSSVGGIGTRGPGRLTESKMDPAGSDESTAVPVLAATPMQVVGAVETLQQSREIVASRWYALRQLLRKTRLPGADTQPLSLPVHRPLAIPSTLVVTSIAGGAGKTSITGTLGRALSSLGERVVLLETSAHGVLPYLFGASATRPGQLRTFSPPAGSADAPVYMATLDEEPAYGDDEQALVTMEALVRRAEGAERVLLDLDGCRLPFARQLAEAGASILLPLAADMNSVIAIQRSEEFFAGIADASGRAVHPWYVLNQYDSSLPLHLDVREALQQQLGARLLPLAVRRSPAVPEALADGMTVIDYAPNSGVADDFLGLAAWLRQLAAPSSVAQRGTRWSEA